MFYNHTEKSNDTTGRKLSLVSSMFVATCSGALIGYAVCMTANNTLSGILSGIIVLLTPVVILGTAFVFGELTKKEKVPA